MKKLSMVFWIVFGLAVPVFAAFPAKQVYLVAVGRGPGAEGSHFFTTVWVTNLTGVPETITFDFLKQGQANSSPVSFNDTLAPGQTRLYEDVVSSKLGLDSAMGAARITSDGEVFATERIFNQLPGEDLGKTEGLSFPAVPGSVSILPGKSASIHGINQGGSENFRSNFALVETGGGSPTVHVQVLDADGNALGAKDYFLMPYEQILDNVADVVPSIATTNARIVATVTTGPGSVLLAGAQIANESQDGTSFEMSFPDVFGGVTSLNGLTGDLTLEAGANIAIVTDGSNALKISATVAQGPVGPQGPAGPKGATGATGPRGPTGPAGTAPSGSFVFGTPGDTTLIGAGFTEIAPYASDYWKATSTTNAPAGRRDFTAVWTGSKMIVWGGYDQFSITVFNTGGVYDPVADTWSATSTTNAPSARIDPTAVWTGSKMIVWGGGDGSPYANTGGVYDPVADAWTPTSTTGAPSGRESATGVWTGSKMIVWGGLALTVVNTGGVYDPAADTWSGTSTTNAPSARFEHTAVWTGSKMIVWGGTGSLVPTNTGAVYDPAADTWSATSTASAPSARYWQTAVWTGTKMIAWGGADTSNVFGDGGVYDPVADSWLASGTSTSNAPSARELHTAVWTGSRMVVWGGFDISTGSFYTGGVYDPAADSWSATSTANAPSARAAHTAVWTGSKMIVWGGISGATDVNTGGVWTPLSLYVKN